MKKINQNYLKSVSAIADIYSAAMSLSNYQTNNKNHFEKTHNLFKGIRIKRNILILFSILVSVVFLYSCGGGGGNSNTSPTAQGGTVAPPPPPPPPPTSDASSFETNEYLNQSG